MPRNFLITILKEEGYYELHGNDALFELNKSKVPTNQNLDTLDDQSKLDPSDLRVNQTISSKNTSLANTSTVSHF